jgi:hypothetical protein
MTPSMYTFASDSTKLGEIPMRKWNVPFDYEGSERRNEEAKERPWMGSGEAVPRVKRGGWFGLFRKSGGVAVE